MPFQRAAQHRQIFFFSPVCTWQQSEARLHDAALHEGRADGGLSGFLKMHPTKLVDSDPAVPDNPDLPKSSHSIPLNPGSDVLGDGSRDKPS